MQKEKKDQHILSNLAQPMTVSGSADSEMDKVFRSGQMVPATKASGKTIEHTVKVNSCILMEMFMMANGSTIRQMAMECTIILMELSMKGTGEMIFSMVKAKSHGQMDLSTRDSTLVERNTELVFIAGTMEVNIRETGLKIR